MCTLILQDQTITVKNPKINSNSSLAKKRMAKAGGAAPPPIQEQMTLEEAESDRSSPLMEQSKEKLGL